ncbi:MAG: hypothetical protein HDS79_08390 [Bacteroidales bacterium]|nr:hypothetical protein [Bacteroidales bacterium]
MNEKITTYSNNSISSLRVIYPISDVLKRIILRVWLMVFIALCAGMSLNAQERESDKALVLEFSDNTSEYILLSSTNHIGYDGQQLTITTAYATYSFIPDEIIGFKFDTVWPTSLNDAKGMEPLIRILDNGVEIIPVDGEKELVTIYDLQGDKIWESLVTVPMILSGEIIGSGLRILTINGRSVIKMEIK